MKKGQNLIKNLVKIVAVIILGFVLFLSNSFFGNPISKFICKNSAEKYVKQNYPGYVIEDFGFNFKSADYYARIDHPEKLDEEFFINLDRTGNIVYNSYQYYVTEKNNTYIRLKMGYDELVDKALADFEYNITLSGGDILYRHDKRLSDDEISNPDGIFMPDEQIKQEQIFDYVVLGEKYGSVVVWAEEMDVRYSTVCDILLSVKDKLDTAGVKFYYIDIYLRQPKTDKGYVDIEGIQIKGFRYSDIYREGLEERIESSHKNLKNYYAEKDAQREKQMQGG